MQFVIEFVGPRSLPSAQAEALLHPDWQNALGRPEVWAMAPGDTEWRRLREGDGGSLDSIALAWDAVSSQGRLGRAAAERLYHVADQFAQPAQRRAIALPQPEEVEALVHHLETLRETLDIGFAIAAAETLSEETIWRRCAALGLEYSPEGSFLWKAPGYEGPLLEVTPLGAADRFSLGAVQRGERHEGVGIGFSVPRSPDPAASLLGCFHVADAFARGGAKLFDEEGHPLTSIKRNELQALLQQALGLFRQADLLPGSEAALRLFSF